MAVGGSFRPDALARVVFTEPMLDSMTPGYRGVRMDTVLHDRGIGMSFTGTCAMVESQMPALWRSQAIDALSVSRG